jgi:acyl carrier protein
VTDLESMRQVLEEGRQRFGALHGVIHAAGTLDDGVIPLKEHDAAAAVLAPKVKGTLNLDALLGDDPLDFLVLFSSVSSFIGLPGQVDYSAANAFLDAYAHHRTSRRGAFTVAVNWSTWQEVGMAAEMAARIGLASGATPGRDHGAGTPTGHPLLQRCQISTAAESVFLSDLESEQQWTLSEHRVKGGDAILPGTAYLELARAALAHREPRSRVELRDVFFLAPLALSPGEARTLRLTGRRQGEELELVVDSESKDGWREHFRGTAISGGDLAPAPRHDLRTLEARCPVLDPAFADAPGTAGAHRHMAFGPRWRNVRRLALGHQESLATLELPEAFVGDLERYGWHPALLDMATGGAQALIPGFDADRDFYAPISYGRLRASGRLPGRVLSHVRHRPGSGEASALAVFDVTLMDEAGVELMEITDFVMKRVTREELALAARRVRPPAVANNVLSVGLKEALRPAEGLEALERILAARLRPQVAVSAQDLFALTEALTRRELAPEQAPGEAGALALTRPALATPYQAPRNEIEQKIAGIWQEILGIDAVGVDDNFFDLGGHSLLLTRIVSRLRREVAAEIPVRSLFDAPTVAGFAALAGQAKQQAPEAPIPAIRRVSREAFRVSRSTLEDPVTASGAPEVSSGAPHLSRSLHDRESDT